MPVAAEWSRRDLGITHWNWHVEATADHGWNGEDRDLIKMNLKELLLLLLLLFAVKKSVP